MRALAELIMSGRWQPALIAFVGLPVISPAAVALVTLRKGEIEGIPILLALTFQSVLWWQLGMFGAGYLATSVAASLLIYIAAVALRLTRSWSMSLAAVSLVSGLASLLVAASTDFRPDLENFAERLTLSEIEKIEFLKSVSDQAAIAPGLALSMFGGVVASLIVARWWQAQLYNPGGFREEFHALRMEPRVLLVCLLAGLVVSQLPAGANVGLVIIFGPMLFSGLGFLHWWAAHKKWPFILWVVYIGLIHFWILVVLIALIDASLNLRKRINANGA